MSNERAVRGSALMREIVGIDFPTEGGTPLSAAARDIVFGEIWDRPGLDKRSRLWITLACVVATGAPTPVSVYAQVALKSGLVTMDEMREFVLHFAMYQGFPKATVMEAALAEAEAAIAAENAA